MLASRSIISSFPLGASGLPLVPKDRDQPVSGRIGAGEPTAARGRTGGPMCAANRAGSSCSPLFAFRKLGGVPVWLSEYWEARRVLTSASCSQARQRCSQFVSLLQHDISCEATVSQTLTRKAKHRLEGLMAKPTGLHFAEATLPGFGARSGRPPGRRHGPVPGSVHTHAKLTKKGPDKGILFRNL